MKDYETEQQLSEKEALLVRGLLEMAKINADGPQEAFSALGVALCQMANENQVRKVIMQNSGYRVEMNSLDPKSMLMDVIDSMMDELPPELKADLESKLKAVGRASKCDCPSCMDDKGPQQNEQTH